MFGMPHTLGKPTVKAGDTMKRTPVSEARLGVAARVKFATPTVTVKRGSIALVTTATVPIKTAVRLHSVEAA